MNNLRKNSTIVDVGIGSIEIFKPAQNFVNIKLDYKSFLQEERYEYTPWVLSDEIFSSRNEKLTTNKLTKYEFITSFTKFKGDMPIDIINQYNVYRRNLVKVSSIKEKIKKIA